MARQGIRHQGDGRLTSEFVSLDLSTRYYKIFQDFSINCEDIYMLGNSRKLRRLNTHRSRKHSNSSDWDNRNLDTDDFYETNLTNNKTCPCSSNTSSSSSRRVLSIGSCARNIHQIDNSMKLTCPRPLRRLTTLDMLPRSKSKIRPAFGVF